MRARWYKQPGQAKTYRITPGDPAASAVAYRMAQRVGFPQMPPIGTKRVDAEGLALVTAWIRELKAAEPSRALALDEFARRLEAHVARTAARLE
jgi:hypothetical protein